MQNSKKKPISITLVAALVFCVVAFLAGFLTSSFVLLDSRLEAANEKNGELKEIINTKDAEIKELNSTIEQKNANNIILGEQIQTHLDTIDQLNATVAGLQSDVNYISEAALSGTLTNSGAFFTSFAVLTVSQQLILLVVLLVILVFIISITCGIIATKSKSSEKPKKQKKQKKTKSSDSQADENSNVSASDFEDSDSETPEEIADDASSEAEDDSQTADDISSETDAPTDSSPVTYDSVVDEAIDLLYHNNLEDSISDLGGFRFGITNFNEILSDKARSKSFGNSENGDFVAFMSTKSSVKRLYIIPRYLTLSDSTVALRGTIDLFDVTDEGGNTIVHGSVKIKDVPAPAVFACGENGWAIESKGKITALGSRNL